jgi:clan AA aspartic protease
MAMTPMIEVEVIGTRSTRGVLAILDTGFDGDLSLPISIAISLGVDLIGEQAVELADGTVRDELVFAASVRLLGETRAVRIYLTRSADALVGTNLLADCDLSIRFPTGRVRLKRAPTGRRKRN